MYEYKAKVLRVVDGDTVDVDIDLGFGVWMHKERVRMMGIDTSESRTRDKVEKAFDPTQSLIKNCYPLDAQKKKVLKKQQIDKSGEDKRQSPED